mmetsp:Transcript_54763/g.128113  ORF Transcript_54763/g.128113 Transcript_54763/m.128113 type:complete len:261 (+) Transcript_54763:1969-2751(+)
MDHTAFVLRVSPLPQHLRPCYNGCGAHAPTLRIERFHELFHLGVVRARHGRCQVFKNMVRRVCCMTAVEGSLPRWAACVCWKRSARRAIPIISVCRSNGSHTVTWHRAHWKGVLIATAMASLGTRLVEGRQREARLMFMCEHHPKLVWGVGLGSALHLRRRCVDTARQVMRRDHLSQLVYASPHIFQASFQALLTPQEFFHVCWLHKVPQTSSREGASQRDWHWPRLTSMTAIPSLCNPQGPLTQDYGNVRPPIALPCSH